MDCCFVDKEAQMASRWQARVTSRDFTEPSVPPSVIPVDCCVAERELPGVRRSHVPARRQEADKKYQRSAVDQNNRMAMSHVLRTPGASQSLENFRLPSDIMGQGPAIVPRALKREDAFGRGLSASPSSIASAQSTPPKRLLYDRDPESRLKLSPLREAALPQQSPTKVPREKAVINDDVLEGYLASSPLERSTFEEQMNAGERAAFFQALFLLSERRKVENNAPTAAGF